MIMDLSFIAEAASDPKFAFIAIIVAAAIWSLKDLFSNDG